MEDMGIIDTYNNAVHGNDIIVSSKGVDINEKEIEIKQQKGIFERIFGFSKKKEEKERMIKSNNSNSSNDNVKCSDSSISLVNKSGGREHLFKGYNSVVKEFLELKNSLPDFNISDSKSSSLSTSDFPFSNSTRSILCHSFFIRNFILSELNSFHDNHPLGFCIFFFFLSLIKFFNQKSI
jgi:hypothetical protein